MGQILYWLSEDYRELDDFLGRNGIRSLFLVSGKSLQLLRLHSYFEKLEKRMGVRIVKFSGFEPNPQYDAVVEGVKEFRKSGCECIFAAGGWQCD